MGNFLINEGAIPRQKEIIQNLASWDPTILSRCKENPYMAYTFMRLFVDEPLHWQSTIIPLSTTTA